MGIAGSRRAFYLFILFFRNYVCGHILGGKKCNRRDRSSRGISQRIKHWTNTARCRAVVSPLLRRMCVCFQKDGARVCMCVCMCSQEVLVRQAGCAGSVWLGWAASYVAALRIADAGDKDAKIPQLLSCIHTEFHKNTHTHTRNPVKSAGTETEHSRKIAANRTRYSLGCQLIEPSISFIPLRGNRGTWSLVKRWSVMDKTLT